MKKTRTVLSLLLLLITIFSCTKESLKNELEQFSLNSRYADNLGPILVEEIIYGNWKGINHVQGICFNEDVLIVSNTKQIIKYNISLGKIVAERKCSDLPYEDCSSFHYGDPAFNNSDLWIPFSKADKWNKNVSCHNNIMLQFSQAQIDKEHSSKKYPLDYPGHIGAVEVMGNKLYVSGRNIDQAWPYDDSCHTELIIYVYDIGDLKEGECNSQSETIVLKAHGKNGIQSLSKFNDDELLITAYKCEDDPDNYVRLLNVNTGKLSLFKNENWAYGLAIHDNGLLYFCEDNRNSKDILIRGIRID